MTKKKLMAAAEPVKSADDVKCDAALWQLYLARVSQVDLIHTVRRDQRAIFKDAFVEAKVALEVFNSEIKQEK